MKASLSCCFLPEYLYDVFVLFAHDRNFSANILLDDQFQPKLTDFAMAHFRPHLEPQSSAISMTSSSSKHVWYMPEECIRQGKLSIKTDVYSFGIVLNILESTQASLYFVEDPPTSLKSFRSPSPLFFDNVPSIPVEDDENQNNPSPPHGQSLRKDRMTQKTPFECSQSEVTFLGFDKKTGSRGDEDSPNGSGPPCEESWSPKCATPSPDLRAPGVHMDPSAEAPGHSYRSRPVETSCSSVFSWNECEQYKKASVSAEDKEESKNC
ncbi:IRAK3 [Cervus elaphus hippelaphus]|uniref:IRAK3 n=1 Tax=Cervus elaphus hippelaphus TaxID=46360 RepID=A0A212DEE8_CEREH|nr:IRAK3 [Cervus elaphus hippelaphus]